MEAVLTRQVVPHEFCLCNLFAFELNVQKTACVLPTEGRRNLQTTASMMMKHTMITALAAGALLLAGGQSEAALFSYYIGIDGQSVVPSGEFAGQANPNANRLTLLFAHHYSDTPASNHYHSKGVYRYQPGSAGSPVIEVNPSNYLPEGSNAPLAMTSGTGLYEGKSVEMEDPANHFSLIDFKSTAELDGFTAGTGEHYMFNSSSGRWTGSLGDADVHLVLVSMSTGLNIGTDFSLLSGLALPGDELHLGSDVDFSPVFWVDGNAAAGLYTAQFKLVDESGQFGDSGTFEFRFNVVPEPSSAFLAGASVLLGVMRRRR